ncbi:MAG: TetR/AcrR family transcriptional regulator [Pseudomonadota bacterium]
MSDLQPYHHGNLRSALIEAAREAVARDGHEALSLRALAEVLGVARSAPYRHFPEKNALLAEVAKLGFEHLVKSLAEISATAAGPRDKLVATGRSFLEFVRGNPELFRLMYEAGLLRDADAPQYLAQAQRDTYMMLDTLYGQWLPEANAKLRQLRMITLWSALYGYAKISQAGLLQDYMTDAVTQQEMEQALLDAMLAWPPAGN